MRQSVRSVLEWARSHPGIDPREHKSSRSDEEKDESAVARSIRDLRAKDNDGKLTDEERSHLTEVSSSL